MDGFGYNNFQAAYDAAVVGDAIQLYLSTNGSGNGFRSTIIKRLVILGPGYYYDTYNLPASGLANTGLQLLPGGITNWQQYH